MLIVPIDEAEPGMTLASNVPHPENPQRATCSSGDSSSMPRCSSDCGPLGVGQVHVDYPGLEELDQLLLPKLEPVRRTVFEQIKETVTKVERNSSPIADFTGYKNATRSMIEMLLDQGQNPLYMDELLRTSAPMESPTPRRWRTWPW